MQLKSHRRDVQTGPVEREQQSSLSLSLFNLSSFIFLFFLFLSLYLILFRHSLSDFTVFTHSIPLSRFISHNLSFSLPSFPVLFYTAHSLSFPLSLSFFLSVSLSHAQFIFSQFYGIWGLKCYCDPCLIAATTEGSFHTRTHTNTHTSGLRLTQCPVQLEHLAFTLAHGQLSTSPTPTHTKQAIFLLLMERSRPKDQERSEERGKEE